VKARRFLMEVAATVAWYIAWPVGFVLAGFPAYAWGWNIILGLVAAFVLNAIAVGACYLLGEHVISEYERLKAEDDLDAVLYKQKIESEYERLMREEERKSRG